MVEPLIIQKKKRPVLLGILIISGAICLAYWLLFDYIFPQMEGLIKFKLTAIVILGALLVWSIVMLLRHASTKKPGLVIDEVGLTDHSNILSVGQIPWKDIIEISRKKGDFNRDVFVVMVRNPQEYVQKAGRYSSSLQYQLIHFGSPIVINPVVLAIEPQELWLRLSAGANQKKIPQSEP